MILALIMGNTHEIPHSLSLAFGLGVAVSAHAATPVTQSSVAVEKAQAGHASHVMTIADKQPTQPTKSKAKKKEEKEARSEAQLVIRVKKWPGHPPAIFLYAI